MHWDTTQPLKKRKSCYLSHISWSFFCVESNRTELSGTEWGQPKVEGGKSTKKGERFQLYRERLVIFCADYPSDYSASQNCLKKQTVNVFRTKRQRFEVMDLLNGLRRSYHIGHMKSRHHIVHHKHID